MPRKSMNKRLKIAFGVGVPMLCIGVFLIILFAVVPPSTNISVPLSQAAVGDIVEFGAYEQDKKTSNGAEAIEWLVLNVQGGKALLISKDCLDARPYNEEQESVTWETCTLRVWLNDDFLNTAFSAEEKARIPATAVENPDNLVFGTDGGNNTSDRVFLLSVGEAERYITSGSYQITKPTPYAVARGADKKDEGSASWWLRTPGSFHFNAYIEYGDGYVYYVYEYVRCPTIGVRPALWVKL